jgi:hypothetical protein
VSRAEKSASVDGDRTPGFRPRPGHLRPRETCLVRGSNRRLHRRHSSALLRRFNERGGYGIVRRDQRISAIQQRRHTLRRAAPLCTTGGSHDIRARLLGVRKCVACSTRQREKCLGVVEAQVRASDAEPWVLTSAVRVSAGRGVSGGERGQHAALPGCVALGDCYGVRDRQTTDRGEHRLRQLRAEAPHAPEDAERRVAE